MKRFLTLFLAILMVLSMAPAAEATVDHPEFVPYDETVVVRCGQYVDPTAPFPDGQTYEDNYIIDMIKRVLNVQLDTIWYVAETNRDEKMNLAIASNDLPDVMLVNPTQFLAMCKADQLADLTDAYNELMMPHLKKIFEMNDSAALKAASYGGKILGIPAVTTSGDGYHTLWIRKDWLDKLNLEVPKTVDDIEKVAKAFVDAKLGGENTVGLASPAFGGKLYANFLESTNNIYGFDAIFSAMGAYPGYWIKDKEGKAVYGSTTPETRAALERLAEMYKNGVLDPEIGVRKENAELIVSGQCGMFFGTWWMPMYPLQDAVRINPEANWQCYTVPLNDEGKWTPHLGSPTREFLVVRKGYEHPEVAVKLENLYYVHEEYGEYEELDKFPNTYYPLCVVLSQPDECQFNGAFLRDYLNGEKTIDDFDHSQYNVLYDCIQKIYLSKKEPYDKYDIQYWDVNADGWSRGYATLVGSLPLVEAEPITESVTSITYAMTNTMQKRWTNLQKLEDETFLKIVVGTAPIEAFDDFVAKWEKEGGSKITEEVNEIVNAE